MSHCGQSTCITTRWLGKCNCDCPDCGHATKKALDNPPGEIGRTTLDTQAEKKIAEAVTLLDDQLGKSKSAGPPPDGRSVEAHLDELAAPPRVLPLYGDGVGLGREETDAALRGRVKAAIDAGGKDAVGDAYRELHESLEGLRLAMLGRAPVRDAASGKEAHPDDRLTDGQTREYRKRYCKAVIADAMFLLERIQKT